VTQLKIIALLFLAILRVEASAFEIPVKGLGDVTFKAIETEILKDAHKRDSMEDAITKGWPPSKHFGWGATFLLLGFGFTISTDSMQEDDPLALPLVGTGIVFSILGVHQIYRGYKKKAALENALGN
jgi:hypothetical protein